jgi:hypothetical protein
MKIEKLLRKLIWRILNMGKKMPTDFTKVFIFFVLANIDKHRKIWLQQ